jgi:hypothetical protein
VTARDSDRVVWRPSGGGLFDSSIDPVEHGAGVSGSATPITGAERSGPHIKGIAVVRRYPFLHERVDGALHALSHEPDDWGGRAA